MYKPISGRDLQKVNKDINVIDYEELNNLSGDKIFLVGPNHEGHWVSIFTNKDGLNFFDSYGESPEYYLGRNGYNDPEIFNNLLNGKKILYNKVKYQGPKTQVCGRHNIVRLMFKNLSNKEYKKMITTALLNSGLKTYDELVYKITKNLV